MSTEFTVKMLNYALMNLKAGMPLDENEKAVITHFAKINTATKKWAPPPIAERETGFRCLAFHRGAWRDVVWTKDHQAWMFGYGSAMIRDENRAFAPLPELPFGAGDFWANDWRGYGR